MISVRSEVQVFPGPPAFARVASFGSASRWEARAVAQAARTGQREIPPGGARRANTRAVVPGHGAIAQLGERVLCKHEVVGSIPSGSTSLRSLCELWLCGSARDEGRRAGARKGEGGPIGRLVHPRKHHFACEVPKGAACGISDIVKRRSIRVGSREILARFLHYLRIISALAHPSGVRVVNDLVSEA